MKGDSYVDSRPAVSSTPRTGTEKQAKDLLKRWKADDPSTARKLADAQFDIAHEHGFTTWKAFTDEIAKRTGAAAKAAIWKSAEDALVAGDDVALARLLGAHTKMLRNERPQSSWFGGLTPDYKHGDARESSRASINSRTGRNVRRSWRK